MWKVEQGGAPRTWQPGAKNTIPGIDNMDSTPKGLLDGVAQAGLWALWMGVFTRGWMDLLFCSRRGMEYHRARSLARKLSQVISESKRVRSRNERNESARSKGVKKQEEEREELRKEVKELWDSDRRSMTLRIKHPLAEYTTWKVIKGCLVIEI
jgi:hypothetical protein